MSQAALVCGPILEIHIYAVSIFQAQLGMHDTAQPHLQAVVLRVPRADGQTAGDCSPGLVNDETQIQLLHKAFWEVASNL